MKKKFTVLTKDIEDQKVGSDRRPDGSCAHVSRPCGLIQI